MKGGDDGLQSELWDPMPSRVKDRGGEGEREKSVVVKESPCSRLGKDGAVAVGEVSCGAMES